MFVLSVKWDPACGDIKYDPEHIDRLGINAKDAGKIIISVRDSGAGISAANQAMLFQEGVQFNANKLQGGKGSGLGLFITKGIVLLHNGSISASSEGEDKGAVFELEYPVVEITASPDVTGGVESEYASVMMDFKPSSLETSNCGVTKVGNDSSGTALSKEAKKVPSSNNTLSSFKSIMVELRKNPNHIKNVLVVDDSSPSRKMVIRLLNNSGLFAARRKMVKSVYLFGGRIRLVLLRIIFI